MSVAIFFFFLAIFSFVVVRLRLPGWLKKCVCVFLPYGEAKCMDENTADRGGFELRVPGAESTGATSTSPTLI